MKHINYQTVLASATKYATKCATKYATKYATQCATKCVGVCSVIILATGCATLSKEECQIGDWYGIGLADGSNGRTPAYLSQHLEACSKHGISPQSHIWEKGRKAGLRHYCTEENAYQVGQRGSRLSPVCGFLPKTQQNRLYQRHTEGKKIYEMQRIINKEKSELRKINKDLDKLKEGEKLGFKTEKAARKYMLDLLHRKQLLELVISRHESQLNHLRFR